MNATFDQMINMSVWNRVYTLVNAINYRVIDYKLAFADSLHWRRMTSGLPWSYTPTANEAAKLQETRCAKRIEFEIHQTLWQAARIIDLIGSSYSEMSAEDLPSSWTSLSSTMLRLYTFLVFWLPDDKAMKLGTLEVGEIRYWILVNTQIKKDGEYVTTQNAISDDQLMIARPTVVKLGYEELKILATPAGEIVPTNKEESSIPDFFAARDKWISELNGPGSPLHSCGGIGNDGR